MAKNKTTLYLDVDDTLIQSKCRVLEMINEDYGTNYSTKDISSWDFHEIKELEINEISEYFTIKRFWANVKYYKHAKNIIRTLQARDKFDIKFLSKGTESNLKYKKEFLKEEFPNIELIGVLVKDGKYTGGKDIYIEENGILVDDNVNNLNTKAKLQINFCGNGSTEYNLLNKENDKIKCVENWIQLSNLLTHYE